MKGRCEFLGGYAVGARYEVWRIAAADQAPDGAGGKRVRVDAIERWCQAVRGPSR